MLTVMSWYVENFFTPATGDQKAYQEKVAELATVITAAAPDVVALQEVGDPEAFETLRSALGAGWRECSRPTSIPPTRSGWELAEPR